MATSQQKDFAAMFEAKLANLQTTFKVGDRISGVVTMVTGKTVFLDVGGRSDGLIDSAELLGEDGQSTVKVGDTVEAYYVSTRDDEIRLTTKMTGDVADAELEEAHANGIPVEGRVNAECKGGYEVMIQNHRAFCPYSQIDVFRKEADAYVGEKFPFIITEYSENGRNLLVSRRKLIEKEMAEQKDKLRDKLEVGALLTGIVTRVVEFGAFVDIGGMEGLVHISQLSWSRGVDPDEIVTEGDSVTVKVMDIDWEKDRISLSLKEAQGSPWDALQNGSSDFHVGGKYQVTITQIKPFGAFAELEPGLEGLIHISRLGAGRRINSPEEVVNIGDTVEITIENIDLEKRRIALTMEQNVPVVEEDEDDGVVLSEGATVKGVIDTIRQFGVFVRLTSEKSGLLHISQIELKGSSNPMRALHDMFPPGSEVEVIIRELRGDRISLTLPASRDRDDDVIDPASLKSDDSSLGSLGDLFGGLDL